jgi:hypothetical protein
MSKPNPEDLEKLIHNSLRSLPEHRAPHSLEANVWAAIQAQQGLPWWRQSFAHWPMAVRATFLAFTGILAAALIASIIQWGGQVDAASALSGPQVVLAKVKGFSSGLQAMWALVLRAIPATWLYGGLALLAMMYVTLIGVGATAYRTLISKH